MEFEGEYLNGERYQGKEFDEIGNIIFEGEYLNGEYLNGKKENTMKIKML